MRIALIDSSPKRLIYPLALMKISSYLKNNGDEVEFFDNVIPHDGFDEIWITTLFTYDIPHALKLTQTALERFKTVKVGGISATLLPAHFERLGADVHLGPLQKVEQFPPDYSILGHNPKYSVSHTTRGCIRKCKFCMTSKLDNGFDMRPNWDFDIYRGEKPIPIFFFDNNWLAKPVDRMKQDIFKIKHLISKGWVSTVDFNPGFDDRVITDEIADLLTDLPISPVRFAFDSLAQEGHYQRAVEMMIERGFKEFVTYVLYNFTDTPQDFYYRMSESARLVNKYRDRGVVVKSFPMRYQPILEIDNQRDFVGEHWTIKRRNSINTILGSIGPAALITNAILPNGQTEFEYWFGKDENEFLNIISYPKLRDLVRAKKGNLRIMRAKETESHKV